MLERARKRLRKRAKRGLRGYPVATVALYGPDDTRATKLAAGIVPAEDVDVTDLRSWFSEGADIRNDAGEVLAFINAAGARSIVMTDRIIGCPHEEGIDYEGPPVPLARSGPVATAGLASAYTSAVAKFRAMTAPRRRSKAARSSTTCKKPPAMPILAPPRFITGAATILKWRPAFLRPTDYGEMSS